MPLTAILFVAAGLACLLGLVACLAQPVWFRFNGKVPSRWKIARWWLALLAICAIFAIVHRERTAAPTEPARIDETIFMEAVPAEAFVPAAQDEAPVEVQDAVKMNEDAAQSAQDMPPERPQPPPPPARSVVPKRAQR